MPDMNEARCNPGVYISPDHSKMYVFQGFIEPESKNKYDVTPLTETVEVLDLTQKDAKWQYISID